MKKDLYEYQLSGTLDFINCKPLSKSLICKRINDKYFEFHKGYVPTFISICPKCHEENEWSTTGILPMCHTCRKCNEKFTD